VPTAVRVPAPDGAAAWDEATRACRGVRVYSSTIRLSGRVAGERVPSGLTIASGFTSGGGMRLEARMVGRRVFTLAGRPDRAVLLFHREREFIVERADRILEKLVGTPLEPVDLLAVLTGCGTSVLEPVETWRVGDLVEVVTSRARVWLESSRGGWRPRLATTAGLQVDFVRFVGLWPEEVRVWTDPGAEVDAQLRLRVDSIEVNSFTLPDQAFEVELPPGATSIDLGDLRGTVGRKGSSH